VPETRPAPPTPKDLSNGCACLFPAWVRANAYRFFAPPPFIHVLHCRLRLLAARPECGEKRCGQGGWISHQAGARSGAGCKRERGDAIASPLPVPSTGVWRFSGTATGSSAATGWQSTEPARQAAA
jgi:hypothetical protein